MLNNIRSKTDPCGTRMREKIRTRKTPNMDIFHAVITIHNKEIILKKSLMENSIFCAVNICKITNQKFNAPVRITNFTSPSQRKTLNLFNKCQFSYYPLI